MIGRKAPCDQTEADAMAWADVVFRLGAQGRLGSVLWTRSLMQDGRDANIMLNIERTTQQSFLLKGRPALATAHFILWAAQMRGGPRGGFP